MKQKIEEKLHWIFVKQSSGKSMTLHFEGETEMRFLVGTPEKALEFLENRVKEDVDASIESVENYRQAKLNRYEDGEISGNSRVVFETYQIEYKLIKIDESWFEVLESTTRQ